jgi:hypothetical protein
VVATTAETKNGTSKIERNSKRMTNLAVVWIGTQETTTCTCIMDAIQGQTKTFGGIQGHQLIFKKASEETEDL